MVVVENHAPMIAATQRTKGEHDEDEILIGGHRVGTPRLEEG
jgi:hypothetical protein